MLDGLRHDYPPGRSTPLDRGQSHSGCSTEEEELGDKFDGRIEPRAEVSALRFNT